MIGELRVCTAGAAPSIIYYFELGALVVSDLAAILDGALVLCHHLVVGSAGPIITSAL